MLAHSTPACAAHAADMKCQWFAQCRPQLPAIRGQDGKFLHARRLVERHFRHAPSPLACLQAQLDSAAAAGTSRNAGGPPDAAGGPLTGQSPSAWQLAGAAMRLVQLMPLQRRLHDQGVLLRLLHHAEPDVRWCAARSLVLLFNLVRGALVPTREGGRSCCLT